MERHFEHQIDTLAEMVRRLGALVEQAIGRSVTALKDRDESLARRVVEDDADIDRLELEIDQLTLTILARYQLAARDLRFVTTALKITPELERMGDHAVNIAERAIELIREPPLKPLVDIPKMATRAQEMVHGALEAFVRGDAAAARAVIAEDDELDHRMEAIFRELVSYMLADHANITRAIRLTFVAKYLERIGDQATNICEQVVFMTEGRVIKHPRLSDRPE